MRNITSFTLFLLLLPLAGCGKEGAAPLTVKAIQSSAPASSGTTQFTSLAQQLSAHVAKVSTSSRTSDYTDDPSYRGIVALGKKAVPLIISRYKTENIFVWAFALRDITGAQLFNPANFNPSQVRELWLAWWTQHQSEYP